MGYHVIFQYIFTHGSFKRAKHIYLCLETFIWFYVYHLLVTWPGKCHITFLSFRDIWKQYSQLHSSALRMQRCLMKCVINHWALKTSGVSCCRPNSLASFIKALETMHVSYMDKPPSVSAYFKEDFPQSFENDGWTLLN